MTTPTPPAAPAVPDGPQHAAPHGLAGEIEHLVQAAETRIVAEVRALATPARLKELAGLTRDLASGARQAPEVLAWLAAHGL